MYELFDSYWWLLFPLGVFLAIGFSSFLNYKRTQAKIELLKAYASSGTEPPAELLASLDINNSSANDEGSNGESGRGTTTFLVILFGGLSVVFAATGLFGFLGIGVEAYFIAAILGVLALAFLFSGIAGGRPG